jgi:DNA-binding IclR family transcriptional regulator
MRTVERVSDILEAVVGRQGGVSLSDLAVTTGLSLATCHRLVRGLETSGMLRRDPRTRRWQAGDRLARIGAGVQPNPGLDPEVVRAAVGLAEFWGLSAYVATLSDGRCVCVATVCPWGASGPALGAVRPLHDSAPAMAILAAMDRRVALALFARGSQSEDDVILNSLKADLDRTKLRGWATKFDLGREESAECAVSFAGPPGEPPRALTLCGSPGRMRTALRTGLPAALTQTARAIGCQPSAAR